MRNTQQENTTRIMSYREPKRRSNPKCSTEGWITTDNHPSFSFLSSSTQIASPPWESNTERQRKIKTQTQTQTQRSTQTREMAAGCGRPKEDGLHEESQWRVLVSPSRLSSFPAARHKKRLQRYGLGWTAQFQNHRANSSCSLVIF